MFENFYNDTDKYRPDYKYWISMPTWEHNPIGNWLCSQPLLLVMNIDPYTNFTEDDLNSSDLYLTKTGIRDGIGSNYEIEKMLALINLSFKIGELTSEAKLNKSVMPMIDVPFTIKFPKYSYQEAIIRQERTLTSYEMDRIAKAYSANVRSYHVKPNVFINWANKKGFRIPEPFIVLLEEKQAEGLSACLNPEIKSGNDFYAPELALAIEVWKKIYKEPGAITGNKGYIPQIIKWLEKNHPELSSYARKRIATMINIKERKDGGALPSNVKEP